MITLFENIFVKKFDKTVVIVGSLVKNVNIVLE